jgi:uncharacterized protein YidB (DUF937 family)
MSLISDLEGLAGNAAGGQQQANHPAVAQALMQEVDQQPGGIGGLLDRFRQNGMEQHVNSWTSPQPNQSITPDQVQQGMGSGMIDSIAQRVGISPGVAKVALAAALPLIVSHLSQNGQKPLPQQGGLAGMASGLLSRAL